MLGRAVDWLVRNRASLPQWVNRILEEPARNPDGLIGRLAMRALGGSGDAPVSDVPSQPLRLLIAPTNYSGQAYRWARAIEAADPEVGARNMAQELPGGFSFPADTSVQFAVAHGSDSWASAEWDAATRFTHLLIEAERPIFGRRFGRDVAEEVRALEAAGVSVAYLCHGTDIRNPARHAERTPWSLYPDDPKTSALQADAETNFALIENLRRPTFVSTPDLLFDVPWATWCPVVIDVERFANDVERESATTVTVVHAASAPLQKGSHYIVPALADLIDHGDIDYTLITGAKFDEMPGVFARADIVIDQFRAGSYGVAACEAMASGCVVVGHVLPQVREHVESTTGLSLPIVEATPDTLREVISDLRYDRARLRELSAAGPAFVRSVHSGERSARVLLENWIRSS